MIEFYLNFGTIVWSVIGIIVMFVVFMDITFENKTYNTNKLYLLCLCCGPAAWGVAIVAKIVVIMVTILANIFNKLSKWLEVDDKNGNA